MTSKVAVITGGNKGIGYEIVRRLCKEFDGSVILTARDEDRGTAAVAKLREEGLSPIFLQLDITSASSIDSAKLWLKEHYGGIDILVNNAGIAFKHASTVPFAEQARKTLETNYFGTRLVSEKMFSLLRPNARVVNMASRVGRLDQVSEGLQNEFSKPDLSKDELDKLLNDYIEFAQEGTHKEKGYTGNSYNISVLGIIALTNIQAREMANDSRENVIVNCVCPGWTRTDLGGPKGEYSPEEAADTPVFAALFPSGQNYPQGEFIQKRKLVNWLDVSLKSH